MNFDDSPEEAAFRAEARAWLEAHAERKPAGEAIYGDLALHIDDAQVATAKAWTKQKADAGWSCIDWPVEHGGRAATPMESAIWDQEEEKFRTPPTFLFAEGHRLIGPTLMAFGTPEQGARWLPRIASGDEIWCQMFSEPSAGSDLAGVRTTVVRDGDAWVVNGQKIWTSHAHYSDWGFLLARNDPALPKHEGLVCFAVDMRAPEIEVRPVTDIAGVAEFNEVFFTDLRIPDSDRVGEVGEGWKVAMTSLSFERVGTLRGGGVQEVVELIDFMTRLQIDGAPAIEDCAVRERLASLYARARGVELAGWRTMTALSRGAQPGAEPSMMKLVSARLIQEAAHYALELLGASGATVDPQLSPGVGPWVERYFWAAGTRIAGGTDEVLRNIIAERVLGLPSEQRVDKGVPFKDVPAGRAVR